MEVALSGGLLLELKFSSLFRNLSSFFRPVCSFSSFERFAPCFVFRGSLFRNSLVSFERFAPSSENSLVPYERFCSLSSSSLVSVEIL